MGRHFFIPGKEEQMNWQDEIRKNFTTAEELQDILNLSPEEVGKIQDEIRRFPMSVTRYYLSLIDPDDPDDPIRKMAVPSGLADLTDGQMDTSGEQSNTVIQGLQHKYAETALILTTSQCAMFCRHCFRRRLVGKTSDEITVDIDGIADYIRSHPRINNVLLSGGDPFLLPTEQLALWLEKMTALTQLDFIRFGTRTPVTFPQRILSDQTLTELFEYYQDKKQIYVVTHFNHPREISEDSKAAVKKLQAAGIVIKNQTVLLRGINDDPEILGTLLQKLTSLGIIPHYIFQCRPVRGVKSLFQVPFTEGIEIVQKALSLQNGLGKSVDYTLSHVTGKIRILGKTAEGKMLFQYKQAKDPEQIGNIFSMRLGKEETWLPEEIMTSEC